MKKWLKKAMAIALVFLLGMAGLAVSLLWKEIGIIQSIQKHEGSQPFYTMEFASGYYFDEILEMDIRTDEELAIVLANRISHGFYKPPKVSQAHIGCSVLTCRNEEGHMLWGRNFDWHWATPVLVKATPENGYASISTCEFSNITGHPGIAPEGIANSFLAIAAYYVPMDGINEKGLCVAELEINEGGQGMKDTEKKNITMTMTIRLVLDRAATVEEAVAVEFMDGEVVVTESCAVTNFNVHNGNAAAGGQSAKERFELLVDTCQGAEGILSVSQLTQAMEAVSQKEGEWKTRWTVIYENAGDALQATYYWNGDFLHPFHFSLEER